MIEVTECEKDYIECRACGETNYSRQVYHIEMNQFKNGQPTSIRLCPYCLDKIEEQVQELQQKNLDNLNK